MIAFTVGAVAYLFFVVVAVLLCKGIALADKQEQPTEVLAPAEVDRARLDTWA